MKRSNTLFFGYIAALLLIFFTGAIIVKVNLVNAKAILETGQAIKLDQLPAYVQFGNQNVSLCGNGNGDNMIHMSYLEGEEPPQVDYQMNGDTLVFASANKSQYFDIQLDVANLKSLILDNTRISIDSLALQSLHIQGLKSNISVKSAFKVHTFDVKLDESKLYFDNQASLENLWVDLNHSRVHGYVRINELNGKLRENSKIDISPLKIQIDKDRTSDVLAHID